MAAHCGAKTLGGSADILGCVAVLLVNKGSWQRIVGQYLVIDCSGRVHIRRLLLFASLPVYAAMRTPACTLPKDYSQLIVLIGNRSTVHEKLTMLLRLVLSIRQCRMWAPTSTCLQRKSRWVLVNH